MFRRAFLLMVAGLLGCIAVVGLKVLYVSEEDREEYREIVASSDPSQQAPTHITAQQEREGVRKEVWFSHPEGRPRLLMVSDSSHLVFILDREEGDIVEHLGEADCWYQSRLYVDADGRPSQQERYFKAFCAAYSFQSHIFSSETVDFADYLLPGHDLITDLAPYHPQVVGTAQNVDFSFRNEHLNFHAEKLKAKVQEEKRRAP